MDEDSGLPKGVTTRKCPGKEGTLCGQFMADQSKDPHSTCSKCRSQICSRNLLCDECTPWTEEQWQKYDRVKRRKDTKLTELESNFSQFSSDFTSHRISTDSTLSSLKSDFQEILAAIAGLKDRTAQSETAPAQQPHRENLPPPSPHGKERAVQEMLDASSEEGEISLIHEEVLLEGEEDQAQPAAI